MTIVPFGRYKGKPVAEMLADTAYVQQLLLSEAICQKYPEWVSALRAEMGVMDEAVSPPNATPPSEPSLILKEKHAQMWRLLSDFGISRSIGEAELLEMANQFHAEWKAERLPKAVREQRRLLCGVIWEVTGHHERIQELGYTLPWWYQKTSPSATRACKHPQRSEWDETYPPQRDSMTRNGGTS